MKLPEHLGSRTLRFLGLAVLWVLFAAYLLIAVPGAWRWAQVKYVRTQDLSRLEAVVDQAQAERDMDWAEKWISARPLSESAALIKRAEPFTGSFSPAVFIEFARRSDNLRDDDMKKFWVMFARFRMRYDALRCGAPDSVDVSLALMDAAQAAAPELMRPPDGPEAAKLARRVLDFDARRPAQNDPKKLCRMLGEMGGGVYQPVPVAAWPSIRFNLRLATDDSLKQAEGGGGKTRP